MVPEDSKRIVGRFWEEVYNGGNLGLIEEIVAPDYELHDPVNTDVHGHDGLRNLLEGIRDFAPEAKVTIEAQMMAEGDHVVTRFTVRVPRQGALATFAPANEPLELSGISISRVSDGRIEESWVNWDAQRLLLGLDPSPADWRWPPWR